MRYKIILSYDGSPFCGWQIQNGARTVQECLQDALSTLLRERISVTGAGRTDSKVHAINYVAHFEASVPDLDSKGFGYKINAILPHGIVVHDILKASPEFHSRFDARMREYKYFIHRKRDPFMEGYSYLYTFPLAGTRPRGRTEEEDKALEADLLSDEKELAEHNMLVDLGRNDLGKISRFGSVQVEKLHSIERYSHVMHIGSTVRGEIRDDCDALDAVEAVLPAGTLSGAPKIRACQLIGELENNKRGIYGGAIGYLDFTGNMDTCIAIRIAYKKSGRVFIRSGAGIVADSVPEKE